jgi:hypothetical protein
MRAWSAAPLLVLFLIAAGLEANASRAHLYQELQIPEPSPPSSLDLALYLAVAEPGEPVVITSGRRVVISQGQPITVKFAVANESSAPQTAVEDPASHVDRILVLGMMRDGTVQKYLPVTWTSPLLRNGARQGARPNELSLPVGSRVGWAGTLAGAEDLGPGIYQLVTERTIRDSGGRPARMHSGPTTVEVQAASAPAR